ncbi:hypothetical protein AVEN_184423-1 [Araneus ventricosus]|uniref:Secreted protein n=1 Tax=Araneus ventricosus TaxID=182803 RepID=A0A4Y2BI08_ARAVE|nr:hypothetical protein AVEN_184423-1 [Araneus ventricosus]
MPEVVQAARLREFSYALLLFLWGPTASTRMRRHRISKWVLASPEGIGRSGVVTSTPMTGRTSYERGWAVRPPTSVPELLSWRSGPSDFIARLRARSGWLLCMPFC